MEKHMKLNITAAALLVGLTMSTQIFASFLSEGGYSGKQNDSEKVDLLLKKANGREGSFFAVLLKRDNSKVSLYMVDKLNDQSYTMTPLEVTADGEIGIVNDDPSLVISSTLKENNKAAFRISSANSANNQGFNGFLEFSGKASKTSWLNANVGEYDTENVEKALQISQFDPNEREAAAVFLTKDISGNFTIREKFPSMHLLNQNRVLSTGTQKNQNPNSIGIFIERKIPVLFGLGENSEESLLLVNPKNDADIKIFKKRTLSN